MQKIASGNAVNPDTVRLLTASGTLDAINDNIVEMDATAGALSLALPAASTCKGWPFLVKKVDSSANAVTINPDGTETIDGELTATLGAQWQALLIESDGVGWLVKASVLGEGSQTITGNINFSKEANHEIGVDASTTANAAGGALSLFGGAANGNGLGGEIGLTGGASTSGTGGRVVLSAGATAAGTGGAVQVTAGAGTTAGGAVAINAGLGNTVGGAAALNAGNGTTTGGAASLKGGDATTTGGAVNVDAGSGATGGAVTIGGTNAESVTIGRATKIIGINGVTQTTVGAAGAATALPAQPTGYFQFTVNGTLRVVPFYAQA